MPPGRAIGPLPRGHGFLGLIIHENQSFRIPDIAVDPRRYGFPPHHPPMHSFLGVPVTVKGRSVGNLYLTDKAGAAEFSAEDQAIVETFARHAAIAIENARLHEQDPAAGDRRRARAHQQGPPRRDHPEPLRRRAVARGRPGDPAPTIRTRSVRRVERAIDNLHFAIRDIRNFIFGLRPELLGGATLLIGVAAIVEEFRHNSVIDVELQERGSERGREPSADTTAHLLGIVNEALSNIARHSGRLADGRGRRDGRGRWRPHRGDR